MESVVSISEVILPVDAVSKLPLKHDNTSTAQEQNNLITGNVLYPRNA